MISRESSGDIRSVSQYKLILKKIKGLGKKKIEQMGEAILAIINSFPAGEQAPPVANTTADHPQVQEEKKVKDTKQESFDLFKAGNTVSQIARIRGFTVSTIEGHLSHGQGHAHHVRALHRQVDGGAPLLHHHQNRPP